MKKVGIPFLGIVAIIFSSFSFAVTESPVWILSSETDDVKLYHAFSDCNGSAYLIYKIENSANTDKIVFWNEELSADGTSSGMKSPKSFLVPANSTISGTACAEDPMVPGTNAGLLMPHLTPENGTVIITDFSAN